MRPPSGASLTKAIPHPDDLGHLENGLRDAFLAVIGDAGDTAAQRFEKFALSETHPAALTAAPGVTPSTAMVAVYPSDEQAAMLRQPNGEDSAILHVTLAFLGELDPDQAELAAGVTRNVAAAGMALSGSVGGVGAFGDNGAGHPSILMPDVVGLAELRHAVCEALCDAGVHFIGCQCAEANPDPTRTQHGWTPHMTLAYHDELTVPPKHLLGRPLDFGQLSFAQGDVRRDFEFGAEADWVLPALGVTAGAVVAETEKGIEIGKVAEKHAASAAPDYGQTYWKEETGTVLWISADWTTIEEADAAIADFLAIEEVESVDECAECGFPDDTWEQVYTPQDRPPPDDELDPDENAIVAAGPPWTQPHPDELVDVDSLVNRFRTKADPVRRATVEAAAAPALDKAGLSFDATNPFVDSVLENVGQHVTFIADTTRLNVMRIVRRSYEEGLSIPDTAKAIREGMAAAAGSRATLIARTEMTSLVNGGSLAAMNVVTDAGVGTYLKRWLTAPGASYPRHEDYEGLDGQTVALNGIFDVGGANLAYPGDPDGPPDEVCNCRCTLVYVEGGPPPDEGVTTEGDAGLEPSDVEADLGDAALVGREIVDASTALVEPVKLGRPDGGPEIRDALASIDKVHKLPELDISPVPVRTNPLLEQNVGARLVSHNEGAIIVPDQIDVNPMSTKIELDFTHAIGHEIDYALIQGDRTAIVNAAHQTHAWQELMKVDTDHGEYLRRDREVFARAYAQWIAERSGNTAMLRAVDDSVKGANEFGLPHAQWTREDFAPIAAEFDRIFADRGLINVEEHLRPPPGDTFSAPTAPFLPKSAIEKIQSLGLADWPPRKGALAKKIFGDAHDTRGLYKRNGEWIPEREAVHENVISQHFAGKTPSARREAYFTAVGGASGKGDATFLVDGQEVSLEQLAARPDVIYVDPDRIKKMLPEYAELAGDPYTATGLHEESSELGKAIVQEAMDRGYSVVLDTTASSDGFIGKIDQFVKKGYTPQVTMFSTPTNEAIGRSLARAAKVGGNSFGRYVPIQPLKDAHAGASRQLAKWSKIDSIDGWRVFDNSGPTPVLVAHGGGGQVTILDPAKWEAILAKAGETEAK